MRKFGSSSGYFLVNTESPGKIRIWKIENPLGGSNATLSAVSTITLDDNYSSISTAAQKGTQNTVDIGDYSISDVVCKDGYLYGAYTAQNTTSNGSMIVYFKVNTNNNYELLNGKIETANKYYYYPVVHPDNDGNIVFVFNKSSDDDYIGIAYTIRYAGSSDITPIQWLKQGSNWYYHLLNSRNRWGDYCGIALDPSNGYHVWICGEWAYTNSEWSTQIGKIITKETIDFTFTNLIYDQVTGVLNANAGGTLTANSSPVNSGGTVPLETGGTYNEKTNDERFSNWNGLGYTYKHNQWNNDLERKFLSNNFQALFSTIDQKAFFKSINYSRININLDGQLITGKGAGEFQDPWYVLSNGSQPGNYWKSFNSFYEPTGKDGAAEKGVFLDQLVSSGNYYSLRVQLTQDIPLSQTGKTHKFYFQNWGTSGAQLQQIGSNPSGYDQKAAVFNSSNATVIANYKGTQLSNDATAFSNNSQRKLVKTRDNWLHQTYESMGRVWLEHSTNNGTTWFLGNNGQPLDNGAAKCPSIDWHYNPSLPNDPNWNAVAVVFQQKSGSVYTIRCEVFKYTNGSYLRRNYGITLYSEPVGGDQYAAVNANPNIAWGYDWRFALCFERKSTIGDMQPGIYWKYGILGEGVLDYPLPTSPIKIAYTTNSSINASISMSKSSIVDKSFDIVYQAGTGGNSNIMYVNIYHDYTGGYWNTPIVYGFRLSTGSGYVNYQPSVVQMPSNNVRVCWIRDLYGGGSSFPYNVNAVYHDPFSNPLVFTYSGNMVNSVSLNILNDNSTTYYAYAQNTNNSNWQNFARTGSNTITLSTTGRHIQLSNGSSSANLCASAYYPVSLPYYFLNSSLGSLPKSSVEENTYGRGVQLVKDNIVFSYSMKSLTADKSTVKFVEIPEIKDTSSDRRMVQLLTIDSLNTFLLSEPFTIQNGMILNFSEGGGFLITSDGDSSVARQLMKNYQINCKIELIEDGTNKSIGIVKQSQFTSKDENNSNIFSSNLALNRSDVKNVRLKITLTTNITDVEGMLVNEYNTVNANILSKLSAENLTLQEKGIVTTYAIEQNYPNPFNPSTTINYQIKEDGLVTLKIYDILGAEVKTLVNEEKTKGRYTYNFNGSNLTSGVYIYQLSVNDFVSSKKLILLK